MESYRKEVTVENHRFRKIAENIRYFFCYRCWYGHESQHLSTIKSTLEYILTDMRLYIGLDIILKVVRFSSFNREDYD